MLIANKRTEEICISLNEFQVLQWNTAMLTTIINARPEDREAVVEAVTRQMAERIEKGAVKGGGKK